MNQSANQYITGQIKLSDYTQLLSATEQKSCCVNELVATIPALTAYVNQAQEAIEKLMLIIGMREQTIKQLKMVLEHRMSRMYIARSNERLLAALTDMKTSTMLLEADRLELFQDNIKLSLDGTELNSHCVCLQNSVGASDELN